MGEVSRWESIVPATSRFRCLLIEYAQQPHCFPGGLQFRLSIRILMFGSDLSRNSLVSGTERLSLLFTAKRHFGFFDDIDQIEQNLTTQ